MNRTGKCGGIGSLEPDVLPSLRQLNWHSSTSHATRTQHVRTPPQNLDTVWIVLIDTYSSSLVTRLRYLVARNSIPKSQGFYHEVLPWLPLQEYETIFRTYVTGNPLFARPEDWDPPYLSSTGRHSQSPATLQFAVTLRTMVVTVIPYHIGEQCELMPVWSVECDCDGGEGEEPEACHGPALTLNVDVRNMSHEMALHIWEQYCSKWQISRSDLLILEGL